MKIEKLSYLVGKMCPARIAETSDAILEALNYLLTENLTDKGRFFQIIVLVKLTPTRTYRKHGARSQQFSYTPETPVTNSEEEILVCSTGALYYYLTVYNRIHPLETVLYNCVFRVKRNLQFNQNYKSILTLIAVPSLLYYYSPTTLCSCRNETIEEEMIYILLDFGYCFADKLSAKGHSSRCRVKTIAAVAKAFQSNPLSLLQLSRLAVRKCMRNIHILVDCYKLPIPRSLQDYVSLKSYNAQVRPWFLKEERSLDSYAAANVKDEVLTRYGIMCRGNKNRCRSTR